MEKRKLTDFNFSVSGNENEIIKQGVTGKAVQIPHTWIADTD